MTIVIEGLEMSLISGVASMRGSTVFAYSKGGGGGGGEGGISQRGGIPPLYETLLVQSKLYKNKCRG